MKFVRFEKEGQVRFGILEGDTVTPLSGDLWDEKPLSGNELRLAQVRLMAPLEPGNIFCIGRNYSEHAKELGNDLPEEPLVFMKPTASLLEPEGTISVPLWAGRIDYEGELAVVIGRICRNASEEEAEEAIFGLTCLTRHGKGSQKKAGNGPRQGFLIVLPVRRDVSCRDKEQEDETPLNGR